MKKIICLILLFWPLFGCSSSDDDVYCTIFDTKVMHGEELPPNPDEGYSHYCVVVNGKAVDEEKCDKEGSGLLGRRYGVAGLYSVYKYDCVKDDDTHLYESNKVEVTCSDGKKYGQVNENQEVCVVVNNEAVYKPVCPENADRASECKSDDVETYYKE